MQADATRLLDHAVDICLGEWADAERLNGIPGSLAKAMIIARPPA